MIFCLYSSYFSDTAVMSCAHICHPHWSFFLLSKLTVSITNKFEGIHIWFLSLVILSRPTESHERHFKTTQIYRSIRSQMFTYCDFWPVKERPLVALLLHGHQLLNHLLLLWIQCGCFQWRGGGDHCGRAGRLILVLLLHLLQSDLFLWEHTYRPKRDTHLD